ncbi:MAG: FAD-dependent oxidoreductase, partial [Lachnospiraceae bacterium]|nr:FAD-dependent oxidoreductase [Lachnospiraceae bacterium]
NASSEPGRLAVNGMSYHDRAGANANSALIVTVTPEDYPDATPLGGVAFQRRLEELAYAAAGGKVPVQLYGDFKKNRISTRLGEVEPQIKGAWAFADLRAVMPEALNRSLIEAMDGFGHMIAGFDRTDAVLAGIESRTSSPVRIWRDEQMESRIRGLYPCGEGAGYAGGITSAAMDGVKVAEAIASRFQPLETGGNYAYR